MRAKLISLILTFLPWTLVPFGKDSFLTISAEEEEKYPFKYPIHWRRADEFLKVDTKKGLRAAEVFYEDIEPNDI